MEESPLSPEQEAIALVRELNKIELPSYRVVGGIVRYEQSARNSMKDTKQRIVSSLSSQPFGCDNYLIWAPPGSGKSFFIQEIARSMGSSVLYRELNLAQLSEHDFRTALSEIDGLDKPRLCFIDEVDSKPTESWPYEALLPSLEPPANKRTVRTCFILAGSSGNSLAGMKENIVRRPKGTDLLSRIPPDNEFVIEALGLGDRLLVVSTQFLNAAREEGKEIREVEKLVLYYVALNPKLKSARNIRQLAVRCLERIPPGEDRIKYDHLFDPGDPENKRFWLRAIPLEGQLVNVFVALEGDTDSRQQAQPLVGATPRTQTADPAQLYTARSALGKNRIAVMPLVNMIADPTDEYFADGMTEELISAISLIDELNVISRTSVMSYKKKQSKRTIDIGRELNVSTLLEGSVRKAGNKVRISVQLIDVETDRHLWAQNYDRNLEDVFVVQSDVASKVAESLEAQLLPGRKRRIENANTKNVSAHLLYLRARDCFFKQTKEALENAIGYYEKATEKDPNYALAYAGIAETLTFLGMVDLLPSKDVFSKAKYYAAKALSLDRLLPEAHLSEGFISIFNDWDFEKAEIEVRRSVDLNPNLSIAHIYLAALLFFVERFDEASREAQLALDLDPLNSMTCFHAGSVFLYTREFDRSIEASERAFKLNPLHATVLTNLGLAHVQKGMFETGIKEMERAAEIQAPDLIQADQCELAYAYSKAGYDDKAREILSLLLDHVEQNPGWATEIAGVYSVLGEKEKAFEWLDKAYERHSGWLPYITVEPPFDNIREDPRFDRLLVKIGLKKALQGAIAAKKLQPIRIDEERRTEGTAAYEKNRIAVLPFSNISPDPRDEYFADGMTEELISTISKISGLQVIARTSVLRYKSASKGIDEIGKELNVGSVLEGSVRKAGEKLRITTQLIDSATSQHLWSESYDRELKDVFAIQSDISRTVAEALKIRLLPSEREGIRKESTENTAAYELFLKGMYYDSNKKTGTDLRKAIECFERAIQLDPTFAPAYSWLSGCYNSSPQWHLLPTSEALPRAEETARKALDLDPTLSEAHVELGRMLVIKFDWKSAEAEFKKAIELNPNLSAAHEGYSSLLRQTRRLDDALVEARKSLQLNPLSRSANYALHWVLHDRGQFGRDIEEYDRAIDHLKRMREFDPDFMDATVLIGWLYLHKSQLDPSPAFYEQAIEEFSKIPNLSPDTGSWWTFGCFAGLVWAYTRSGRREEAKKIQARIQEFSKTHYVEPQWLANIHLGLGENDEAIRLLDKAYEMRDYDSLGGINVEPMFDAIRSDRRFVALLEKIGLDEYGNLAIPSG